MRMILAAAVTWLAVSSAFAGSTPEPLKGEALEAAQARVALAHQLISVGHGDKDPQMLLLGARLLFKLGASVSDPKAKTPASYNINTILDEARGLAAGNDELLHEIDALKRAQPAQGACNWQWLCGGNGCGWAQVC
ncbi:MAG: hypothetical protein H7X89_10145 [Rhizobiales bacterium]|nr:hypothetical protein [Hyphomicrobiales bacterium]